jgi:hypothetical protein
MTPSKIRESSRERKADPDREGRTAWGLGGAAPASLDVYGQSSKSFKQRRVFNQITLHKEIGLGFMDFGTRLDYSFMTLLARTGQ